MGSQFTSVIEKKNKLSLNGLIFESKATDSFVKQN